MARKNITASFVRQWLTSDEGQKALKAAGVETKVGTRGRHNPAQVAVFQKHNKRLAYTEGDAEARTIEVRVPTKDKAGRNRTKRVVLTTAEARKILGHAKGTRGRISQDALVEALTGKV